MFWEVARLQIIRCVNAATVWRVPLWRSLSLHPRHELDLLCLFSPKETACFLPNTVRVMTPKFKNCGASFLWDSVAPFRSYSICVEHDPVQLLLCFLCHFFIKASPCSIIWSCCVAALVLFFLVSNPNLVFSFYSLSIFYLSLLLNSSVSYILAERQEHIGMVVLINLLVLQSVLNFCHEG